MKKIHVLIPSLVAVSAMPFVGLTSCVVQTGGGDAPEPVKTYVVTLFAGEGTFGDTNQIILSNIKPGTLLKDVEGYKTPKDESFTGWLNNGSTFKDNQPVNANMLLTAEYSDPSVKYKAYVVKTDDKQITLSNEVVTDGQPFETTVEYLGGDIVPKNISVYAKGIPVENPTIVQGVDSNHVRVELDGTVTNGDVAIVVNFPSDIFHSYICNDPDDGLEMIDNTIPDDKSTVGTFKSFTKINNVWSIKRVIIGGVNVDVENFKLLIDTTDAKKATIKVLNIIPVNGDVLIWFEPNITHVEWQTGDPLPEITPLPAGTPQDQALEQFNEFVLSDKENICIDDINDKYIPDPLAIQEFKFDVYDISYNEEKKWFNVSWDYSLKRTGGTVAPFEVHIQARNLKAYVAFETLLNHFYFTGWASKLEEDEQELRDFLISDESWSIVGYVRDVSTTNIINLNNDYIASLTDEQWDEQNVKINSEYCLGCMEHEIYYLQNIIP